MISEPSPAPQDAMTPAGAESAPDRRAAIAGDPEQFARLAATAAGAALIAGGLPRRSLGGLAEVLVGGVLLFRGAHGRWPLQCAGGRSDQRSGRGDAATDFEHTVSISRPAPEVYDLWRGADTLQRIFAPAAQVAMLTQGRASWRVETPPGKVIEWDTELVEERRGEYVKFRSVDNALLRVEGEALFTPAEDGGTRLTLRVSADAQGSGPMKSAIRFFRVVPEAVFERALARFKSLAETGQVPPSDGPSQAGSHTE